MIQVTPAQAFKIVVPYTWHQLREQLVTVMPVVAYMMLFQLVILRWGIESALLVSGGIATVVLGLMFFMEGVKIAILPLGETIGRVLPQRTGVAGVLIFSFLLGVVAAYGEPVIGSLQVAGAGVDAERAPLLHAVLLGRPFLLVAAITTAVGTAFVVGMLRFIRGWSVKPLVLALVGTASALSLAASGDHDTAAAMGLAWDVGAVIAGPVSTPLVLALGAGVALVSGRSNSGMVGFGSVGLMSLFPTVFVLGLVLVLRQSDYTGLPPAASASAAPALEQVALESLINAARAIVPVFVFLLVSLRFWLKEPEEGIPASHFAIAAGFAVFGLFLFNFGLAAGLGELGEQVGTRLPSAFHPADEALYGPDWGKLLVVVFGALLGYGATLAEPAFNTLGQQVEEVTQGAFKKWLFGQAVAIGVGVGAGLGMASLVYGLDLLKLLLPPYLVLFGLTLLSDEEYTSIAWDAGAVTTGPVTVPLKITIGIALSHATGFAEGFGILALASAYPVLNILMLGLYVRWQRKKMMERLRWATES